MPPINEQTLWRTGGNGGAGGVGGGKGGNAQANPIGNGTGVRRPGRGAWGLPLVILESRYDA